MNKNLEKITSDLFVDWSECSQNIPVNGSYFDTSTNFVFDNANSEGDKEDEENS